MSQTSRLAGVVLAAAAATLFVAGCKSMDSAPAQSSDSGAVKVKCYGANACKGQSECKTAMSSCKAHNECKGQGFVMLEERACIEKLGRA